MFGIFEYTGGSKRQAFDCQSFSSLIDAIGHINDNVKGPIHVEIEPDHESANFFVNGIIYTIERI